ncbi:carboxymuconolactone decarboxylase family protein [Haliea sp. E17]|uniref:carboxymuconolactone decarboxylase family protein n=1 Tax=Haliea sp. E17 TaxID=3401576 RepID=UPI003AAD0AD0
MTLLDPTERSERGSQIQAERLGAPAQEPATLLQSSWRDYIFAEVWNRPGLDTRSRYWISIAGAACETGAQSIVEGYIRGGIASGAITLAEVREAALHLAVYAGWSRGTAIDEAATRAAAALGIEDTEIPLIRGEVWDPEQRLKEGHENFDAVMIFPPPPPVTPYFEGGILNFVFGEMWTRPGLDQRSRRWITLVGVAESSARIPIRTHTYAAMRSGNATMEEMHEYVLQYAIHGGWPKASVIQGAVFEMGKLIAEGKPYED